MFQPTFFYHGRYYMSDPDNNLNDITESINDLIDTPIVVLDGTEFKNFDICVDLLFINFCIRCQRREEEFSEIISLIEQIKKDQYLAPTKDTIFKMRKIILDKNIEQLYWKNKDYYNSVTRKILENVKYFNENFIQIDSSKIQDTQLLKNIKYINGKSILPITTRMYSTISNRIGADNLYPIVKKIREYFIPENDCIIEIDNSAAELNFLLYICEENNLYPLKANSFWENLCCLFESCKLSEEQMKLYMNMTRYGAGPDLIQNKLGILKEENKMLQMQFQKLFPKTYEFMHGATNKYFSKDFSTVYDFFGREITCDDNYKKLNFFLQSSQSTYFQLFVNQLIAEMQQKGLASKILFTHHDSFYIDLNLKEKEQFYDIFNKTNNTVKPKSKFRQQVVSIKKE